MAAIIALTTLPLPALRGAAVHGASVLDTALDYFTRHDPAGAFDRLDAVLIESTSQLAEPTGLVPPGDQRLGRFGAEPATESR